MIVTMLMGFLADLVFSSTNAMHRSFQADMDRYVTRRGLRSVSPRPTSR